MDLDKADISSNSLTNKFTIVAIDKIADLSFKKYLLL